MLTSCLHSSATLPARPAGAGSARWGTPATALLLILLAGGGATAAELGFKEEGVDVKVAGLGNFDLSWPMFMPGEKKPIEKTISARKAELKYANGASLAMTIAEGGMVSGNITAKNVRICGALNGSVRSEMVTLTATARVVGDIHHELLAIETGGQLEGMSRRLVPNPQAQVMQAEEYRAHEHSEG